MKQLLAMLALALGLSSSSALEAANIVISNLDNAGEGFNDTTPVAPEGGNTGTTLGQQRLLLIQTAAKRWGALLKSKVSLRVGANFDFLPCSPNGSVFATTTANRFYGSTSPPDGLQPLTYYPVALFHSHLGYYLNPELPYEMTIQVNSNIDNGCAGATTRWWYGIDSSVPVPNNRIALLPTLLHELAHGLGFITIVCTNPAGCPNVNSSTRPLGSFYDGIPDIWSKFTGDVTTGLTLDQMSSDQQRVTAMTHDPFLVWTGDQVFANVSLYQPGGEGTVLDNFNARFMRLHAPSTITYRSSIEHWTADAANPNLLMEPTVQTGVSNNVDLTYFLFQDIGWKTNPLDTIFTSNFDDL